MNRRETVSQPITLARQRVMPKRSRDGSETNVIYKASTAATRECDFAGLLFERDRTVLYPEEIAARLKCTKALVIKLIEGGDLGAINIGSGKTKFYRIPAAEWEQFLRRRASV